MDSARLSALRSRREQQQQQEEESSSSEDSEDESTSSSSSSGSSSSGLSSSASSTEDETEDPKPPPTTTKPSNAQSSVKNQSSASSKSDSVDVKSAAPKSSPEPTATRTVRSFTQEVSIREDDKNVKKTSKFAENESDSLGARKSKIPFPETSSKKISSAVAEAKNEELPNLSARKSIATTRKASEVEEGSGKVETKSEELPDLSAKKSAAKKSSEVEEVESEKPASKISGIREKTGKVSALDDDSKGKTSKEKTETTSNETPEKNPKEVSGKVSKLSGSVKKFENPTEEKDSNNDSTKSSGVKVKKSSASAIDDEAKADKVASDAVVSVSKKNPASEKAVEDASTESDKISKIPKFKKLGEKNISVEEKVEKPAKLSGSEKQKLKETVEEEKVEKPVEKVGKKSKIPSAENSTAEDDKVEKPAEKVSKKSKISSAENSSTVEDDKVEKPVEKVSKKSKISSTENSSNLEDDNVEKPVEKVSKKSKISSAENSSTLEEDTVDKPAEKVSKKSKTYSTENSSNLEDDNVEKPVEKVSKKSKILSAENSSTVEEDKVEKPAEKVSKKSKISSTENSSTVEEDKVEKPAEKVSKKSKISSAENITAEDGGDKKSEVLDIEVSSGSTLEVVPNKETTKKRKKSPLKDTAEGEDERKPSETPIDDLKKPSAEIKTDKDQATDSNKLSVDIADLEAPTKTKKGSKRSSKSPTPVMNETIADENQSLEAVENVEKIINNEPSNKLSAETAETEAPANIKKASKKSSKSPTLVNEAIEDEKPSSLKAGEDAGKLSLGGVDLANTAAAVVEKIDLTKLEITGTKPSEENTTGTVVLAGNLGVAGESVAKETGAKEIKNTSDTVADEAHALKKTNAVEIITLIQESQNKDATIETLEKPAEEKNTADETETATTQPSSKSKAEDTYSVPVKTATVEDTLTGGGTALGPAEDDELKFDPQKETVDSFIQRILSEARSSDQHLKELAKERAEAEPEAPVEQNEEQTNEETKTIIQVATKESADDEQVVAAKPPAAVKKPAALEQTPKEDNDQIKQRSRYPADDEDEELAILAKYFGRKGGRPLGGGTDPLLLPDVNASDELDSRSLGAAEIMRRRRQDRGQDQDDYDFDGGSDYGPPFARTMAGPKVSRRNFQRYNFGESDFNGREDGGFVSRYRRERHGGSGVLPDEAFVPRRSEETPEVVRQKSRGARALVDKQSEVVDSVKRASKGLDDLEREIITVKQASLGYRTRVETLETAFDAEARTYESEYQAAVEGTRQRRAPAPTQRKREDFVGLMFDSKPNSFADPPPGADAFASPAVASFMNIYGSGQRRGPEAMVNGVAEGQRHEVGVEGSDVKVGSSKVDDYMSALERRYESSTGRKDREPDAGISGWSPTVSGIDVGTSASDELLNRIRAKYPPISSLSSSSSSLGDPTRFSDLTSMSGYVGPSSNGQWSNRGLTRGSSGGYSGGGFSTSSSASDGFPSWRDKGSSGGGRRSNHFAEDGGGHGSGSDYGWRRSGGGASDSYLDRPFSTGSRTRRT